MSVLIAKKLTEKDTIISITFWQAMGCVPLAFIASLFVWEMPSLSKLSSSGHRNFWHNWSCPVICGVKSRACICNLPFDYIRIMWSAGLGYLLFGQLPTSHLYIGSLLIIGATAFLSYGEAHSKRVIKFLAHQVLLRYPALL